MADLVQMKIPKTYDEQILNLQEKHGLIIADCAKAKEILKTVNYYRLSAYGIDLLDKQTDKYREGTSLEQIYSLYQFDSRLRNIISPVIEYVEIRLRSCISYHLAIKYGAKNQWWFTTCKNTKGIFLFGLWLNFSPSEHCPHCIRS